MHKAHPFILWVLLSVFLVSCSSKQVYLPQKTGPDVSLNEDTAFFLSNLKPQNQGMTTYKDMESTLAKSLKYTLGKPQMEYAVYLPNLKITWADLTKTLQKLQELLPCLDTKPDILKKHFKWVAVPYGIAYSGYYEPEIFASKTKKPGFEQAVYKVPDDLTKIKRKYGKYYDRKTIEEKQVLAGRNLELAWASDPVDVFFLEIQGSGKIVFDDGTETYVNYAAQNGHKYKSSGRIMREKGLLERGDIFEQREWFKANPSRVREILNENPSYVFFKFGNKGSTGAMGYTVDGWKSLAVDKNQIPLGAVLAFGVNIPDQKYEKVPLRGIGFAQDVGGAIKNGRIDIFCGNDERANYVASHLDAKGPAWILLAN